MSVPIGSALPIQSWSCLCQTADHEVSEKPDQLRDVVPVVGWEEVDSGGMRCGIKAPSCCFLRVVARFARVPGTHITCRPDRSLPVEHGFQCLSILRADGLPIMLDYLAHAQGEDQAVPKFVRASSIQASSNHLNSTVRSSTLNAAGATCSLSAIETSPLSWRIGL